MNYLISNPSPLLAPYIKHYWAIEDCIPKGKTHRQRIVQHGMLELTFYLGDKPVTNAKNQAISENNLITG